MILAQQLKQAAHAAGKKCDFPECEHITLGFHCADCGRKLCNVHLYYTMADGIQAGPKAVCPSCVADRHPEMFEDDK
jgi:DNA-directed RNA polymerase subunit RPC12/RpoP